jgi:carboxyl-terminal processing protease
VTSYVRAGRWLATVTAVVLLAGGATATTSAGAPTAEPAPCTVPTGPLSPVTPTTVDTIGQAYRCLLDHYVDGPTLADQTLLLTGAFAGLTRELDRRGLERADATAPALTGDRDSDWTAFAARYRHLTAELPASAALRQALAAATIHGMIDSLHDNHVDWAYPVFPAGYQPGETYGLGLTTYPDVDLALHDPGEALPPLFVSGVNGGPADAHGLLPGDVITAIDGTPPFPGGVPAPGVLALLSQQPPSAVPVRLTLYRPATGHTTTATLTPALYRPTASPPVAATLLDGDLAAVRLSAFVPGAADRVLDAVHQLAARTRLHGVVLDLRGNGGGSPGEVARLLGAFAHDRTWSYDCDSAGACTPNRTDGTVPLLHLPLVLLTDRDCASACDAFTAAVKDLHLGTLVGTRTAGVVSGPAAQYLLSDNSTLRMPSRHERAAAGEPVNGIGVAPDIQLPLTPRDLSTHHDPALDRAAALLHQW